MHAQTAQFETIVANAKRNGTEWSIGEIDQLRTLRESGMAIKEIAIRLDRTYYSVATELQLAGLAKARTPRHIPIQGVCSECRMIHAGECL